MLPTPLLQSSWILYSMPIARPPTQEGPGLKYQPSHPLVNPDQGPNHVRRRTGSLKLPLQVDCSWNVHQLKWHPPPPHRGRWGLVGGSSGEWRKVTMISRSNIMCHGRWLPLGCQPPNRRLPGGGMSHPGLVGFVLKSSCWSLMPPAPRTSRLWGKRRPCPWPRHYRPVLKNLGPPLVFYATLHGNFRGVFPQITSVEMTQLRPPSWSLLKKNMRPPPPWRRKPSF